MTQHTKDTPPTIHSAIFLSQQHVKKTKKKGLCSHANLAGRVECAHWSIGVLKDNGANWGADPISIRVSEFRLWSSNDKNHSSLETFS